MEDHESMEPNSSLVDISDDFIPLKPSEAHGTLQLFDEAFGALLPFLGRRAQPLRRLAKTWRTRGIGHAWKPGKPRKEIGKII